MHRSYKVTNDQDGLRLDRWFKKNVQNVPQGLKEKLIRQGKIKIDKKKVKSSTRVYKNNLIEFFNLKLKDKFFEVNKNTFSKKHLVENENNIIYNDDDYIIINKKNGIPVQGGTRSKLNLVDLFAKSKIFNNTKPYTVHRLDKETSGLLIFAKNRKTAQFFTSLFRLRKIHKKYLSICWGEFKNYSGELIHNLERYEKNKKIIEKAVTRYNVIDQNLGFSLVEMRPITGRKHQLRKQASIIGNPIVGDDKYTTKNKSQKQLMLHSYEIRFIKNNKKIDFKADIPKHFRNFLLSKKINHSNY